ncbi:MAG: J domain-containing protein [Desulfobacteraceae bacterium]|nr:MAG: J domain-containing protein [Desulfobacteraceae bacterium]
MSQFWKVVIIVLILLYILSPMDLLPGFSPISLLDDAFLTGLLIYYLKNGRMPAFITALGQWIFGGRATENMTGKNKSGQGGSGNGEGVKEEKPGGAQTNQFRPKDPYEVLEISPGATKQEIQAAYRKIVPQYHPDKVAHLGREIQDLAKEKFVEIQNAYDALMNG